MPFIITNPKTKIITQKYMIDEKIIEISSSRTLDHVTIDDINIRMPINNPLDINISVKLSIGYMDGTVFFPVEHDAVDLAGESLIAAMMASTKPDISHYADFKASLYELLVFIGKIPTGTIS